MLIFYFLVGAGVSLVSLIAGIYIGSKLKTNEPIPPFEALDSLIRPTSEELDRSDEKEYEIEQMKKNG